MPSPQAARRDGATTLDRARAFIDAHAELDIGIDEIAAAACVTPRTVQLTFRRRLGTTPLRYLRRVRLARAREQLLSGAEPVSVTVVAGRWRFASPSHFTSLYRQEFGECPSRTRRARTDV
jgi:AraC-like DNA-binding protein